MTSPVGDGVASEEARDRLGDGLGTFNVQKVADALDRALVDIRERRAQERSDLDPQGLRATPEHRQDGALNGGGLLGAEAPLPESGQLDAEESVSVLDRLLEGAGQQGFHAERINACLADLESIMMRLAACWDGELDPIGAFSQLSYLHEKVGRVCGPVAA